MNSSVCIADWKITSSASIYPFATICWIHVNMYLKTFKFVDKKSKSTKNFATPLQYLRWPCSGRGPPVEDLWHRW